MRNDGTVFTDRDVHRMLRLNGVKNPDGEWFRCTADKVKAAIIAVREGQLNEENRSLDFAMWLEQKAAVEKTAAYFASWRKENLQREQAATLSMECQDAFWERPLPHISWRRGWDGEKF